MLALTDSTGAVVAEYDYDAWGNSIATGLEGTVVNPYRYAGYRWDTETGCITLMQGTTCQLWVAFCLRIRQTLLIFLIPKLSI